MSALHHLVVAARRLFGRHPWLHWAIVAAVALAVAASVLEHTERVDTMRDTWGERRLVWVASRSIEPGRPIIAERIHVPVAVLPDEPAPEIAGVVARQHIGTGEIVTRTDVVADVGVASLVPDDWLAIPIVESPRVGATVGDRVHVVSDGFVIASDALVVALVDDVTLVAARPDDAPLIAAAAADNATTLLLDP